LRNFRRLLFVLLICGYSGGVYAVVEDILNCGELKWMENCDEINRKALDNPTIPLRLHDDSGNEYNFAPGTPSALIRFYMQRTPTAAKEFVDENPTFTNAIGFATLAKSICLIGALV